MKKKSHILITGRIACRMFATSNDAPLLWGSILPDLLFCTYFNLHTWENTRAKTFRKMRRLSKTGCTGSLSELRLGYILHYIEDYFTYPHNTNFKGSIEDHVKFENAQARWITNYLLNEMNSKKDYEKDEYLAFKSSYTNVNDVIKEIIKMHAEYMKAENPGIENDLLYASKAVSMICEYYVHAFAANEKRFFEFPVYPKLDYTVYIPKLAARISLMTKKERQCA